MSSFIRTVARVVPRVSRPALTAARPFSAAAAVRSAEPPKYKGLTNINEIKTEEDLLPPGAPVGTIPTDLNLSTGLDRLEVLGRMQGIDVFDLKPLDSSRKGTMENPIMVKSGGTEQYLGCTGSPADSHFVRWLTVSHDRPIERCSECGSVYKMEFIGQVDEHHHEDPNAEEPKTMADFIKPEYRYL